MGALVEGGADHVTRGTMSAFTIETANQAVQDFLTRLRRRLRGAGLHLSRLPGWLRAASVRAGWIQDSLVAVFEDHSGGDAYSIRGPVGADTVVLLGLENYTPVGIALRARERERLLIMAGAAPDIGRTTMRLVGDPPPAYFDCGFAGYHGPRALLNFFFQQWPIDQPELGPVRTRFVPFAFYVHAADALEPARLWKLCEEPFLSYFGPLHGSELGAFYEQLDARTQTLAISKRSDVIVLGKYSGVEGEELQAVQAYLQRSGYTPLLIKDLPEIPVMSTEEKVRIWALGARFCVMVDRIPAGHIAEHEILKAQRSILALLRPRGGGSTFMIGDAGLVDLKFIRLFEFDDTPLEALPEAIAWAEQVAVARAEAYGRAYPWRTKPAS